MSLPDPGQGSHRLEQFKPGRAPRLIVMSGREHGHPARPALPVVFTEGPTLQELPGPGLPAQFHPQIVPAPRPQCLPSLSPSGIVPDPLMEVTTHPDGTGNPEMIAGFGLQTIQSFPFHLPGVGFPQKPAGGGIADLVPDRHLQPSRYEIRNAEAAPQDHLQACPVAGLREFHPTVKPIQISQSSPRVATLPDPPHQILHPPGRPVKTVGTEIPQSDHKNRDRCSNVHFQPFCEVLRGITSTLPGAASIGICFVKRRILRSALMPSSSLMMA